MTAITSTQSNRFTTTWMPALSMALVLALTLFAPESFAGAGVTTTKIKGFFDNINTILTAISVVVVTVAIIFCGYQITFAHKRISDVAPILIGALLIGGAAQIAGMIINSNN